MKAGIIWQDFNTVQQVFDALSLSAGSKYMRAMMELQEQYKRIENKRLEIINSFKDEDGNWNKDNEGNWLDQIAAQAKLNQEFEQEIEAEALPKFQAKDIIESKAINNSQWLQLARDGFAEWPKSE